MRRPHRSRADAGQSKLVNLLWVAVFAAAVYFGIMYIPVYTQKWEVKSMLQEVANQNWRNYDLEKVQHALAERCKAFNTGGNEYFLLDTENIVVDNNETTKLLTVKITWTRIIPYPLLNKQTSRVFSAQYTVDTNSVKY
jgi:hypothetical protein